MYDDDSTFLSLPLFHHLHLGASRHLSKTITTLTLQKSVVIMASSAAAGSNAVWKEPTKDDKPPK